MCFIYGAQISVGGGVSVKFSACGVTFLQPNTLELFQRQLAAYII